MATRLRRRALVGAALALSLALTACSAGTQSTAGGGDEVVQLSTAIELNSFDPTVSSNEEIMQTLFNALYQYDPSGVRVPRIASSSEATNGNKTWTFKIRDDIKFSDGTPLTVDDIVWTYQKIMADTTSRVFASVASIQSVRSEGTDTVVFDLKAPAVFTADGAGIWIVSKAAYEAKGPDEFAKSPIGSGPYTVDHTEAGPKVFLNANPDYWEGAPSIAKASMATILDDSTVMNALLTGGVDARMNVSPLDAETVEGNNGLQVLSAPSNKSYYVGFNVQNPQLSDIKLRQAVNYAINRDALTDNLFKGRATPTGQVLPTTSTGYSESIEPTAYDPEKAKALLAESSYKGEEIELAYPSGAAMAQGEDVVQAVAQDLAQVGINTKLVGLERATFFDKWFAKSLPGMHLFNFTAGTGEKSYKLLNSAASYDTAPIVQRLAALESESDEAQRQKGFDELAQYISDNAYYAPLFNPENLTVLSSNLEMEPSGLGVLRPYELHWK